MRTGLEIVRHALHDVAQRRSFGPRAPREPREAQPFCAVRYDPILRRPCGMLVPPTYVTCPHHSFRCAICRRQATLDHLDRGFDPLPHSFRGVIAEWHAAFEDWSGPYRWPDAPPPPPPPGPLDPPRPPLHRPVR